MNLQALAPYLTYPDASTQASVRNTVAVAKLLGTHLHALALETDIPPVSNALSRVLMNLPEMIRQAEGLSARNGADLLAAAKAEAGKRGLEISSGVVKAQPAIIGETAAHHARYFDVALIGWNSGNQGVKGLAEAVLFGSGRPTVLIPDDQEPVQRFSRVAVAWDASRVAARAAADARILLERAEDISVITVTDEKPLEDANAGERFAESLRRSGLKASYSAVRAEDCPIAETLQRHAVELGAGLLVMGGYGHSRLRDFVLGGATQGVLSELRLPILLSH